MVNNLVVLWIQWMGTSGMGGIIVELDWSCTGNGLVIFNYGERDGI